MRQLLGSFHVAQGSLLGTASPSPLRHLSINSATALPSTQLLPCRRS